MDGLSFSSTCRVEVPARHNSELWLGQLVSETPHRKGCPEFQELPRRYPAHIHILKVNPETRDTLAAGKLWARGGTGADEEDSLDDSKVCACCPRASRLEQVLDHGPHLLPAWCQPCASAAVKTARNGALFAVGFWLPVRRSAAASHRVQNGTSYLVLDVAFSTNLRPACRLVSLHVQCVAEKLCTSATENRGSHLTSRVYLGP